MNNMKLIMENGDYILWKHDEFRKQLSSVQELPLAGFNYPRYPKPEKCHDDMVQACGLATTASMIHLDDYRLNTDITYASLVGGEPDSGLIRSIDVPRNNDILSEDWGEKELTWGMYDSPWGNGDNNKNVSFKSLRHRNKTPKKGGGKWW